MDPIAVAVAVTGFEEVIPVGLAPDHRDPRRHPLRVGFPALGIVQKRFDFDGIDRLISLVLLEFSDRFDRAGLD